MKKLVLMFASFVFIALSGCDKDRDEKENKHDSHAEVRTAEKYGKVKTPNVSGKWVGTWTSNKDKSHGGGLSCEATEKSKNEWEAVFTAEYGNAVIRLHPAMADVVAGRVQREQRKLVVLAFGFLDTQHVGLVRLKPRKDRIDANPDGVDVVSCDFQIESAGIRRSQWPGRKRRCRTRGQSRQLP